MKMPGTVSSGTGQESDYMSKSITKATKNNSPAPDKLAATIGEQMGRALQAMQGETPDASFAHRAAINRERKLRASLGIAKLPVPKVRKSLPGQISLWGDA